MLVPTCLKILSFLWAEMLLKSPKARYLRQTLDSGPKSPPRQENPRPFEGLPSRKWLIRDQTISLRAERPDSV